MSDPHPDRLPEKEDKRSFLQKVAEFIHPGPDSAEELIETLAEAEDNQVIGADSRVMIERVIRMADMTAGDVMVASPRMDMIDIDETPHALLRSVIDAGHSRFPVFQGERENIIGILMAKDLLKLQRSPDLHIRTLIRPAVFVPESKGLNDLLREFRGNRNHLAIVIDEFGRVAGLVTIEDVLEQIVGKIDDEHDDAEDGSALIDAQADGQFVVDALTPIGDFNERFGAGFPDDEYDTIGGLVTNAIGHLPEAGEELTLGRFVFRVARADARRLHALHVGVHADH